MDKPAAYLVRGGSTDNASLLFDPPLTTEGLQQACEAAGYLAIQGIGHIVYLEETAEKQLAALIATTVPRQKFTEELYAPTVFICYPSREKTILSSIVQPGGIAEWRGAEDIRAVFKSMQVPS